MYTRDNTNNKIELLSYDNSIGSTSLITLEPKTGIAYTGSIGHCIEPIDPHEQKQQKNQSQWASQMEEQ